MEDLHLGIIVTKKNVNTCNHDLWFYFRSMNLENTIG
jgi:hypothetical protein